MRNCIFVTIKGYNFKHREVSELAIDFSLIKTRKLTINGQDFLYYPLSHLQEMGYAIERLPFSIRILLEAALRQREFSSRAGAGEARGGNARESNAYSVIWRNPS